MQTQKRRQRTIRLILFLLTLLILSGPPPSAAADIGPKPTMSFTWDLSEWGASPEIGQVNLYECGDDASCSEPQLVEELGAQRMTCDESGCFAMLYSSGGYWLLEMDVDGNTLISAPFEKTGYDSDFDVNIYPNTILIVPILSSSPAADNNPQPTPASRRFDVILESLAFALAATLAIELIIAVIYLVRKQHPRRLLVWTVLGNLLTVPLVWLFIPTLSGNIVLSFVLQFFTAFLLETLLYRLFGGKTLGWRGSFALGWWTNLGSEALGLLLLFTLGLFV